MYRKNAPIINEVSARVLNNNNIILVLHVIIISRK